MVSSFISRLVILVFGTLYPAYASYKAVRTKNVKEYVKWMMYWIVFALFTCAETFTDLFFSFWFPFYYEIKIITVIYLLSPATKGSSILYRKFVHPVLIKREQEIDEYIAKAKEQGYHTMLNLGSKGVTYATSLIMQTAIKGGGGLVNQLRRSYSLSDLDEEQSSRRHNEEYFDVTDGSYDEDPGRLRRKFIQNPTRTIPSPYQPGLYFSEVDYCQQPDEEVYRQIPSSEEISSGYSSADPVYYGMRRPKGEHLVRTASLGPSSRVRTRAAIKNGLPKRASLSEGGPPWSALEPHESQNETSMPFNFPLSHSTSLPFPFPSFESIVMPDYQHLYRYWTQNQMFTFINNTRYSNFVPEEIVNTDDNLDAEKSGSANKSIIISEEKSDNSECHDNIMKESDLRLTSDLNSTVKNDETEIKKCESDSLPENKTEDGTVKGELESENIEMNSNKNLGEKEKPNLERSGKYNKKPAPVPPAEEQSSKTAINLTVEDEETAFFTPNASPKPIRKLSSSYIDPPNEVGNNEGLSESKSQNSHLLELPKKSKLKAKKDFMSKKLHMPKMTFSFWQQKGVKQSSASESSSIASADISATKPENKNDLESLEYFIPLKDSADKKGESGQKEES